MTAFPVYRTHPPPTGNRRWTYVLIGLVVAVLLVAVGVAWGTEMSQNSRASTTQTADAQYLQSLRSFGIPTDNPSEQVKDGYEVCNGLEEGSDPFSQGVWLMEVFDSPLTLTPTQAGEVMESAAKYLCPDQYSRVRAYLVANGIVAG